MNEVRRFKEKVENIAEKYAVMVERNIDAKLAAGKTGDEDLREVNEGIRLLNHVANALERIDRLQTVTTSGHEEHK